MEIELHEFLERAVQQTILALEARESLPQGTIAAADWFRSGEGMARRPYPRMLEYYLKWAPHAGLIIPFFLNHLFQQHRVTGEWFVLYRDDAFDLNVCYLLHHQLPFVVSEHVVISVAQAFITALHESPDFKEWREGRTYAIRCPNSAYFSLYNHNGSPGFRRE
jgi:hypothetical protein